MPIAISEALICLVMGALFAWIACMRWPEALLGLVIMDEEDDGDDDVQG